MIYIGLDDADKRPIVERYVTEHGITKTVVISPKQFPLGYGWTDNVEFMDSIQYVHFYRLVQEINEKTLVVLSECLRSQNRYELVYNVQRIFLGQTPHRLIFNQLPMIDSPEDFMILFDFDTQSRWKRRKWDLDLILDNAEVKVRPLPISFNRVNVPASAGSKERYVRERERLFANLGAKDPHTLPRNLYLVGGKDKLAYIDQQGTVQMSLFGANGRNLYVARNQRLKRDNVASYGTAVVASEPYTIIEFPHRFIEFSDFMKLTNQYEFDVLVTDLKVDEWYWRRYNEWKERIHETYTSLLTGC